MKMNEQTKNWIKAGSYTTTPLSDKTVITIEVELRQTVAGNSAQQEDSFDHKLVLHEKMAK